jgi:general secretion pathway protein F/type IV pilus assembly protein PilC
MAYYQYKARSPGGEEVSGVMQADNEAAVVRTLDDKDLFPVAVLPQAQAAAARGGRIRPRDVGVLYGQLGDLLRAGVPLLRALETLSRTVANKRLVERILSVRDSVAEGKPLADAMGEHGDVFASLHVAMVRAGERAGFLEDVLANLADFIERQDDLRSRIRGAMIYPAMLILLGLAAVIFVLVVLVPKFKATFHGMHLPLPTQIMFAFSDVLVYNGVLVAAVLALGVVGAVSLARSESGRRTWARWQLRIPLVGPVIRTIAITRFCRILGTMLANGVPILHALSISKDATGNPLLADCIERATENVRGGEPLAAPLRAGGLFPDEIVEMIAVAEESNQLERVLVHIADTVERRTNRRVDQAVRLIEPLILVVIAAVIGFVALGLLYPIFTMSQALRL